MNSKIIVLIMSLFLTSGSYIFAGINLVEEGSSFETGWDGFSCLHLSLWSQRNVQADPIFDTTTSVHGKTSIKFTGRGRHSFRLSFKPFVLNPGKPYTFSFYAKSSQPNTKFAIRIQRSTHGGGPATWPLLGYITANTEWKRQIFTFNAPEENSQHRAIKDRYYVEFQLTQDEMMVAGKKGIDFGNIWLDAIQLEEGSVTEYCSGQEVEIGITAPNNGKKIYYVGETPGKANISIYSDYNIGKAVLNYRIIDYYFNTEISKGQTTIKLSAGKSMNFSSR